jgi:uncharacterized protein YndB with AHSA1/START domain
MREFTRTFSVSVPIERCWHALTDVDELNQWYFPVATHDDGSFTTELHGVDEQSKVLEADPPCLLRTASGSRETTITLESTETGTRVTLTHAGFGDGEDWDAILNATTRGTEESLADLVLFLETGVAFPRHPRHRPWAGFTGIERAAALEVRKVAPGTFAAEVGLQPGDLVVELGGGPVFGWCELWFFLRSHDVDERAEVAWVRGGQLMHGAGSLGDRATALAGGADN